MRKLLLLGALAGVALVVVGVSAGSGPAGSATGPSLRLENNGQTVRGFTCQVTPSHGGGTIFTNDTVVHLYTTVHRDYMKCVFHYGSGSMPGTPYTERDFGCVYNGMFFETNRYTGSPKKGTLLCKHGIG